MNVSLSLMASGSAMYCSGIEKVSNMFVTDDVA